jgi:hypothetical protein
MLSEVSTRTTRSRFCAARAVPPPKRRAAATNRRTRPIRALLVGASRGRVVDPVRDEQDLLGIRFRQLVRVLGKELQGGHQVRVPPQRVEEQDAAECPLRRFLAVHLQGDLHLRSAGEAEVMERVSLVQARGEQVLHEIVHQVVEVGEHALRGVHHDDEVDVLRGSGMRRDREKPEHRDGQQDPRGRSWRHSCGPARDSSVLHHRLFKSAFSIESTL